MYEIYSVLNDLAHGRRSFAEPDLEQRIGRWAQEFERMNVVMQLADRLATRVQAALAEVKEREGEIGALQQSSAGVARRHIGTGKALYRI